MALRQCLTPYRGIWSPRCTSVVAFHIHTPIQLTVSTQADLEELFAKYGVQKNIDILHAIVTEAKERSRQNETRNDIWREDLDPHNAVSARSVPILQSEAQRIRELVAEVRFL